MRRSTLVILLLFLGMAGAYYYLNHRAAPTADIAVTLEPTEPVSYLFKAEDGTVRALRLEARAGGVVALEKNADNAWALALPLEASADQAAVEAAVTQLTVIRVLDTLPAGVALQDVGLDAPTYTFSLKFETGVERKALIGVVTPSEAGYYAKLDGDPQIVIVSRDAIDALIGLLNNPPYAETPTPSPIPPTATETPLPATPEPVTPTATTPQP